MKKYLLDQAT